jgi:hypothetical protein
VLAAAWAVMAVLAVAAALAVPVRASSLVTLQVEPKSEECFYVDAKPGETINVHFQVIRGGKLDIKLRVRALSSWPGCLFPYSRLRCAAGWLHTRRCRSGGLWSG